MKESTKQRNRKYASDRRLFQLLHPNCQIIWDDSCSMRAEQVHHVIPRVHLSNEQMLDQRYWLSTCNHCHTMVHAYPAFAYERGVLKKSWEYDPMD